MTAKPRRRNPRRNLEPAPPALPGSYQIGGLLVPAISRGIEWTDPKTRTPLLVDIEWSPVDGRAEPVRVSIYSRDGDRPITSEIVRRVPIGSFVTDERAKRRAQWEEEAATHYPNETDAQRDEIAIAVEQHSRDAKLSVVADVYRAAWERGESVQQAVAERFGITPSGAAKKIAAARARGFLGEAIGTKAGERQPEGTDDEES